MSKYQGQRTATINSLCDDIIYCNYDKSKYNTVLFPVMAGVTNADPEYFIKRSPNDPAFKYLYVLEYVVSGRGYIEYEGQKYTVEAGDFYLLNRTPPRTIIPTRRNRLSRSGSTSAVVS